TSDIGKLAAAVAAIAGNGPIVFVCAPEQAVSLKLWAPNSFRYPVLASSALADGVVIAIAANALVNANDPAPRFAEARDATIHMDTSPAAVSTPGAPNVVAAPLRSLWQTDTIGLRMILQVAWGLRNSGGLAWTDSTVW